MLGFTRKKDMAASKTNYLGWLQELIVGIGNRL